MSLTKFFFLILLLSINFCSSYSQTTNTELDSLKQEINKAPNDSLKLKALMTVALYHYGKGDYREALNATKTARQFAMAKGGFGRGIRLTYNMGMLYTNLSIYDSAQYYLEKSREMSLQEKNFEMLFQSYNALGSLANYQTNYSLALTWFFKGLEVIEQPGNEKLKQYLSQAYGNIGKNLIAEKQYDKGIEYLKKVLLLTGDPDQPRYNIQVHIEIFSAYMESDRKEKAKLHLDTAIVLSGQLDNIQMATIVANSEGYYYRQTGDYLKAIPAMKRAASLCDSSGNEYLKSDVLNNLAGVYLNLNDLTEAKRYSSLAIDIAHRISRLDVLAEAYDILHQASAKTNDFANAYKYALLHKQYSDSTSNETTQKNILNLEARYQAEKKEK